MQSTPVSRDPATLVAAIVFAVSGLAMVFLGLKGLWDLQSYRAYGLTQVQVWFVAGAVIAGGALLLTIAWSLRGTTSRE